MKNFLKSFLALVLMAVAFTSCNNDGATMPESSPEASDNAETTIEGIVGKWERRNAEGHYILTLTSEGTGKLISYEQTASATENFRYSVTDKGIVVEWGKLKTETYHAVLTVDGKYLVFDNGSSVYVYKKKEK